ncbi:hypothetical protein [Deinococcus humi]|uniref:Uncharacterized protein n=1 Tax=Deinococcus humi TaxID=662880 RepID=A0A7W8NGW3_9DEIO|nr:hypothetical protein [Deinococcus humi]MBB5365941.1 hypothetical protein [Deinococcus humi]
MASGDSRLISKILGVLKEAPSGLGMSQVVCRTYNYIEVDGQVLLTSVEALQHLAINRKQEGANKLRRLVTEMTEALRRRDEQLRAEAESKHRRERQRLPLQLPEHTTRPEHYKRVYGSRNPFSLTSDIYRMLPRPTISPVADMVEKLTARTSFLGIHADGPREVYVPEETLIDPFREAYDRVKALSARAPGSFWEDLSIEREARTPEGTADVSEPRALYNRNRKSVERTLSVLVQEGKVRTNGEQRKLKRYFLNDFQMAEREE